MAKIFMLLFLICFGSVMVFNLVPWLLNKIIVVATVLLLMVAMTYGTSNKLLLTGVCGAWMIFALLKILNLWQTRISLKTIR